MFYDHLKGTSIACVVQKVIVRIIQVTRTSNVQVMPWYLKPHFRARDGACRVPTRTYPNVLRVCYDLLPIAYPKRKMCMNMFALRVHRAVYDLDVSCTGLPIFLQQSARIQL